jgi:DNA-binding response OmpR family regulator
MSGRELARHVRQRHPALPILLLTGDTDAQEGTEHLDAVVQKPFKLDALEATIQRVLEGGGPERRVLGGPALAAPGALSPPPSAAP